MTLSILIWLPLAISLVVGSVVPRALIGRVTAIGSLVTVGIAISFIVRFKIVEHEPVTVRRITFIGNEHVSDAELREVMQTGVRNDRAIVDLSGAIRAVRFPSRTIRLSQSRPDRV